MELRRASERSAGRLEHRSGEEFTLAVATG